MIETNKLMLEALEIMAFTFIGETAFNEEVATAIRQQVADDICDGEGEYQLPEFDNNDCY